MVSAYTDSKHAIARAVVVSGLGVLLGFALYQLSAFTPTRKPFQFTLSSVTIGLAYAASKAHNTRNGVAALFVWYVLLTGFVREFNFWLPILNLAYIGGMTGATLVHQHFAKRGLVKGAVGRIVLAGVIVAVANGLIVWFLSLFYLKTAISHAAAIMETVFFNLQLGALIGVATGLGMEVAECLIAKYSDPRLGLEHDNTANGRHD